MPRSKPAELDTSIHSDMALLKCPSCKDTYLHQENTTIYQRGEDADWTRVMAQNGNEMVVTDFPSQDVVANPSSRRHGLVIEFWCETCGGEGTTHKLAIYQHKGNTFVEWV